MRPEDVVRLKGLEKENSRLKRIVADQALDMAMLREVSRGNSDPGAAAQGGEEALRPLRGIGASGVSGRYPAPLLSALLPLDRPRRGGTAGEAQGAGQQAPPLRLSAHPRPAPSRRLGL